MPLQVPSQHRWISAIPYQMSTNECTLVYLYCRRVGLMNADLTGKSKKSSIVEQKGNNANKKLKCGGNREDDSSEERSGCERSRKQMKDKT